MCSPGKDILYQSCSASKDPSVEITFQHQFSSSNEYISISSVCWHACVFETNLASFGASRTPGYTDHSWWPKTTAIKLMNLILYMIYEQSFDNYFVIRINGSRLEIGLGSKSLLILISHDHLQHDDHYLPWKLLYNLNLLLIRGYWIQFWGWGGWSWGWEDEAGGCSWEGKRELLL